LTVALPAAALTVVPPGNRNEIQPPIPYGAVSRTRATNGSFEGKYQKIRDLIARNAKLRAGIKTAATRYGIDPVHIVGALVGEHTYNVDALDHIQTYVVKAASYFGSKLSFQYDGETVSQFVSRTEFLECAGIEDSYDLWSCRERIWETVFRGRNVAGKDWPNDRIGRVFFQPLFAGQTFGLGQLNPLTALAVNDMVVRVSSLPQLDAERAPEVYKAIMDPDSTLEYMAAVIRTAIDGYRDIAGMDISGNPGITATLYNLGDVRERAKQLKQRNTGNGGNGANGKAANGKAANGSNGAKALPQENYYGWLVNDKIDELRALVN
jgi:hypothetical protein